MFRHMAKPGYSLCNLPRLDVVGGGNETNIEMKQNFN